MAETVALTLHVWQEEDYWAGECIELGTATDGPSAEAVLDELGDLVVLTVEALGDAGERERVFAERGITVYRDKPPTLLPVPSVPARQQSRVCVQFQDLPLPPGQRSERTTLVPAVG